MENLLALREIWGCIFLPHSIFRFFFSCCRFTFVIGLMELECERFMICFNLRGFVIGLSGKFCYLHYVVKF